MQNNRAIGTKYEQLAKEYLSAHGYEIVESNYYCKKGELDLIAKESGYLVFIEVKYRKNEKNGSGFDAVHMGKQKKMKQSALFYLMERHLSLDQPMRFDVVSVDDKEIKVIQNAFEYY